MHSRFLLHGRGLTPMAVVNSQICRTSINAGASAKFGRSMEVNFEGEGEDNSKSRHSRRLSDVQ